MKTYEAIKYAAGERVRSGDVVIENGKPGKYVTAEIAGRLFKVVESYRRHLWECYHSGMSMEQFNAHEDVVEVDEAIKFAEAV